MSTELGISALSIFVAILGFTSAWQAFVIQDLKTRLRYLESWHDKEIERGVAKP